MILEFRRHPHLRAGKMYTEGGKQQRKGLSAISLKLAWRSIYGGQSHGKNGGFRERVKKNKILETQKFYGKHAHDENRTKKLHFSK